MKELRVGGLHFSGKCSQGLALVVTCCAVTDTLEAAWLQGGKGLSFSRSPLGPLQAAVVTGVCVASQGKQEEEMPLKQKWILRGGRWQNSHPKKTTPPLQSLLGRGVERGGITAKVPLSNVPPKFESKLLYGLWRQGRKLGSHALPATLSCPVCYRAARGAASGAVLSLWTGLELAGGTGHCSFY